MGLPARGPPLPLSESGRRACAPRPKAETMTTDITRVEIADHLGPLFERGAVDRAAMLAAVSGARPGVGELLRQLPDRSYASLRQVWEHLPQVPVGL